MKEKMMNLVRGLDVKGLESLWNKTNEMKLEDGAAVLREAVMDRLEELDAEKFELWLDDEDFTRFAA